MVPGPAVAHGLRELALVSDEDLEALQLLQPALRRNPVAVGILHADHDAGNAAASRCVSSTDRPFRVIPGM